MCITGVYPTHVLSVFLHMYLPHMLYTSISTHVIHIKHHTCITGVTLSAMYQSLWADAGKRC